jgi:hypothetical protein
MGTITVLSPKPPAEEQEDSPGPGIDALPGLKVGIRRDEIWAPWDIVSREWAQLFESAGAEVRGLHVSVRPIFTFGSDIPLAWLRLPSHCARFVFFKLLSVCCGSFWACCRCLWCVLGWLSCVFAGSCRARAARRRAW